MSPSELQEYIKVMREGGVKAFKSDGLEIALGPERAPGPPPPAPKAYTDEQLLFACTEGLPTEDP